MKRIILFLGVMVILTGWTSWAPAFSLKGNVIIDDGHRRIVVTHPFTRIISLYPAHTENLVALGAYNSLIGVSMDETYPPCVKKKQRFSYHFGVERFVAVSPDLVLVRPMIDFGHHALMEKLERSGITVISLQPKTIKDLYVYWRILGLLTGKVERANRLIRDFKRFLYQLQRIGESIPHKKRVYFESIHRKMKTFTPHSLPVFVLHVAGGINIAQDAKSIHGSNIASYGKEKILSKANEIDVYIAQRGRMNRVDISQIKDEPGFSLIKAVKNNQIYIVDEQLTSRPSLRLLLGIYEIGHVLYPKKYPVSLKRKIDHLINEYYECN